MYVKVHSSATVGIDAYIMEIELDMTQGLPGLIMVGLPDSAVRESKERVRSALYNSGYSYPQKKLTLNLAPADIPKEGASLDLPIAIALITAFGLIPAVAVEKAMFLGELALDGTLRPVKGVLPVALSAKENGFTSFILPYENAPEAAVVSGINIIPVQNLQQAVKHLNGQQPIEPMHLDIKEIFLESAVYTEDFSHVKGQEHAKRALEVAAAGRHNVIMIGPPGSGKSMLAKRLPSILPPISFDEALETTKIHSIHGSLPSGKSLMATRPFRSPHHSVSDAGLIGGGTIPRPGEVSLSHYGILFLDELPEFSRNVLENLRQPLEDGVVTISRIAGSLTFPSKFMLVGAANPCPCGYYNDTQHVCRCTPPTIQRYMSKLSGPLLDRIDIHVEVPSVTFDEMHAPPTGETSSQIRERVMKANEIQIKRFESTKLFCNAHMGSEDIKKFCVMDDQTREFMRIGMEKLGLSARAYDRVIKVARTIADLDQSETLQAHHISEAIQYRTLDRKLWMK